MLLDLIFSGELLTHNQRLEVLAIVSQHFHVIAG
jgi:hypothetical protein